MTGGHDHAVLHRESFRCAVDVGPALEVLAVEQRFQVGILRRRHCRADEHETKRNKKAELSHGCLLVLRDRVVFLKGAEWCDYKWGIGRCPSLRKCCAPT